MSESFDFNNWFGLNSHTLGVTLIKSSSDRVVESKVVSSKNEFQFSALRGSVGGSKGQLQELIEDSLGHVHDDMILFYMSNAGLATPIVGDEIRAESIVYSVEFVYFDATANQFAVAVRHVSNG